MLNKFLIEIITRKDYCLLFLVVNISRFFFIIFRVDIMLYYNERARTNHVNRLSKLTQKDILADYLKIYILSNLHTTTYKM